jgi:hypothetical protein
MDFITKAKLIHGNKYDYSKSVYIGSKIKLSILCFEHGFFDQSPQKHLSGQGCAKCGQLKSANSKRFSTKIFIQNAINLHGDLYDYSLVEYITARKRVKIICSEHGQFEQVPRSHLIGAGCDQCSRSKQHQKQRFSTQDFIEKSKSIHNDRYDYSLVDYVTARMPVKIICPQHGKFEQIPDVHMRGGNCYKCRNIFIGNKFRLNLNDFLERAAKVHGRKYDYSLVAYETAREPIDIICPTHGVFQQLPDTHLNRGSGCPRCGDRWQMQNTWLDSLGVLDDAKHRQVPLNILGRKYIVDGYDPETKTVYEFWGSYYHGHPDLFPDGKTFYNVPFKELYEKTLAKREIIISGGYMLIEIWEHEWRKS